MTGSLILAIDEGTTNAKAVCIDQSGQIIAKGSRSLNLSHPKPAWSEQDPWEIVTAVKAAVSDALQSVDENAIQGLAISNQRESVLIWDRATGTPLTPVVTWQCRRSEDFCAELSKSSNASIVEQKSGLPVDPLFPAAKIHVLLNQIVNGVALAEYGKICVGTVDTWLVWNLTGMQSFVTDPSNASRTQLFNIHTQDWDDQLLKVFGIPRACLAEVLHSSAQRGVTKGFSALKDGLPILSQIGDSHAALYGQGGFLPGMIKATYGTGSSLMTPLASLENARVDTLAQTVAWHDGQLTYALEGNITHTGAGVAYIAKLLGINDLNQLDELAVTCNRESGVYFVPALSGLGAPHWDSRARGLITGLTDTAGPAELANAAFEAIAYQVADVFFLMETMSGSKLDALLVDGGPTQNHRLMLFQANLIGRPVIRSKTAEVSALGAGYLAGVALGWWSSREDLAALRREAEIIAPELDSTTQALMERLYQGWKDAVKRTLFSA